MKRSKGFAWIAGTLVVVVVLGVFPVAGNHTARGMWVKGSKLPGAIAAIGSDGKLLTVAISDETEYAIILNSVKKWCPICKTIVIAFIIRACEAGV